MFKLKKGGIKGGGGGGGGQKNQVIQYCNNESIHDQRVKTPHSAIS